MPLCVIVIESLHFLHSVCVCERKRNTSLGQIVLTPFAESGFLSRILQTYVVFEHLLCLTCDSSPGILNTMSTS